jgi:hypothetical protein
VTVQTLVSDSVIWAAILLIVVGGAALVSLAVVSVMSRPGGRFSPEAAQATRLRIVKLALVIYVAAFIGGLIVGLFQ